MKKGNISNFGFMFGEDVLGIVNFEKGYVTERTD